MGAKVHFLPWGEIKNLSNFIEGTKLLEIIKEKEFVALKTHFGEVGNKGYVKPEYIKIIAKLVKEKRARPFLTDTNTIYHGKRNNGVEHLELAREHGFTLENIGVPVVIADGVSGQSYKEVAINGTHFKKVKIADAIIDVETIIAISHFKGHLLAGIGGAIKNLGMGCGARLGKFEMHSTLSPIISSKKCILCGKCIKICSHNALKIENKKLFLDKNICAGCGECIVACDKNAIDLTWNETGKSVQERLVEYALGAALKKRLICITFINHVTKDCDCMSKDEAPLIPDVGVMISDDPVAIDQAAVDMVNKIAGKDLFREKHPRVSYEDQLIHAERIGLGRRSYESC